MMLKIGEFARLARVSIATLRHYDQYDLLKPGALDPDTGYRYYGLDQLPRLNRILALKELGFPLEQIGRLLDENISLEQMQGMFKLKQAQTQALIEAEQARLLHIAARLRQIEQEGKMPRYEIVLKEVEPLLVASIREMTPLDEEQGRAHQQIMAYLAELHVQAEQPDLLLFHSRYTLQDDIFVIDMETAIPLSMSIPENERIKVHTLPGALVASTIHTGYDLALGQAHAALHHWIQDNGYRIVAPPRQLHLQRAGSMDPGQYVTEMQFPVEKG